MNKPALVILAAGMGSRYGGAKQIDPIDAQGHIIIDFSIFDAIRAGFEKIVFIIKKEIEKDFKEVIGNRIEQYAQVEYVYQELVKIPEGIEIPEGRVKPWGTGHAILCCKDVVDGPFAVINADDYYGKSAFQVLYNFLSEERPQSEFAMVGYVLENTLTDNGHVARGICSVNEDGYLTQIDERIQIEKRPGCTAYTEDDGKTWNEIPEGSTVSMNMWGFQKSIFGQLEAEFKEFLEKSIPVNPLKCEYLLPTIVGDMLNEGKATVEVLKSEDKWYGVTYKEDKEFVMKAIQSLKDNGVYPKNLWD